MKIGVIGAGAMGSGIAQVAAQAGMQVWLIDAHDAALEKSKQALHEYLSKAIEKGKHTQESAKALTEAIHYSHDIGAVSVCQLVIEAIVEKVEIKQALFQSLSQVVGPDCIIATNTSSLSVTLLASAVLDPTRFIGLHFFNPAPLMALVEVIPALQTSEKVTKDMMMLMAAWGKVPVQAKDTPGFIVNRVARPFYGEALRIAEEGLASMQDIDAAMKEAGFRMGPFELMDLIGNDVNYAVTESVFASFYYDPRYKPSLMQKKQVEAGWLGRKSGRGFYRYDGSATLQLSSNAQERAELAERVIAMLMNEALDAFYLSIATEADLDTAMTKGVNYPKGLVAWAREWGYEKVHGVLDGLYNRYKEDRYRPVVGLNHLL
jgi:3-hydroxybutyryl-CoA dehydrogenase